MKRIIGKADIASTSVRGFCVQQMYTYLYENRNKHAKKRTGPEEYVYIRIILQDI